MCDRFSKNVISISFEGNTSEGGMILRGAYSSSKDLLSLNTVVGDGYIAADVWIKVSEDAVISVEDADVNAILSSITVK